MLREMRLNEKYGITSKRSLWNIWVIGILATLLYALFAKDTADEIFVHVTRWACAQAAALYLVWRGRLTIPQFRLKYVVSKLNGEDYKGLPMILNIGKVREALELVDLHMKSGTPEMEDFANTLVDSETQTSVSEVVRDALVELRKLKTDELHLGGDKI